MDDQIGIQATQYIISLFENSKSQSERALDSLPGVYAVIDRTGLILKGNKSLAQIFNVDFEELLNLNLRKLFSPQEWEKFERYFPNSEGKSTDFKSVIRLDDGKLRDYLWYSEELEIGHSLKAPQLFAITGHDVTELTRVTQENSRMQFELGTAKLVQNTFYPTSKANFGSSTISGYSESASECGGDWWHYSLKKDKLYLWIGDVTGHGVTAALVVSAVHAVVSTMEFDSLSPKEILGVLNQAVGSMAGDQRPMTFLVASIDLKSGSCVYASAGHEPMIYFPGEKNKFDMKDLSILQGNPSVPLGVRKTFEYEEHSLQLKKGDRLLFYTDGSYDIANRGGDNWNRSKFHRVLARQASASKRAEELTEGLHGAIEEFRKGAPLRDDVTFFSFEL